MSLNKYFLSDNPFPETAICDPNSRDPRLNGSIFNIDILKDKIDALSIRTENAVNLIYVSGNQFDRGLGKSSLIIHHYKNLKVRQGVTCSFVRCLQKDKIEDVVRKTILEWHNEGYLWDVFKKSFSKYTEVAQDPLLQPVSINLMFQDYPDPPDILPFLHYSYVSDIERKIELYVNWLTGEIESDARPLTEIFKTYLSMPPNIEKVLEKRKVDCIEVYRACINLFNAFGYSMHYVFFDQFEDMVMGITKNKMGDFALIMKSLLSGSPGSSIFVTLHPSSENKLKAPTARDLKSVAPFDTFHRVNLLTLDIIPEKAIRLVEEYLNYYRFGDPPYPSYPFEPELLLFTWYFNKGVIRNFIQQLHHAIKSGVMLGYPEITFDFAQEHQLEIFGKLVTDRMMKEYTLWRERTNTQ